jgi:hypothetical protein
VDGVAPQRDVADGDRFAPGTSQALIDAGGRQDTLRRLALDGRM